MNIRSNLEAVNERILKACLRAGRSSDEVTLVAITKTVDPEIISSAYEMGVRNFGENRIQEAETKIALLSRLCIRPTWHMVGHLQSNKVNSALGFFNIIHSVDSVKLAEQISRRAAVTIPILLQVNVSGEGTKNGFPMNEIELAFKAVSSLPNVEIRGLMTIAPIVEDPEQTRPVFRKLRQLRDHFHLEHLSMGMTDDYEVAVEEGATMVRIGRGIFGGRPIC